MITDPKKISFESKDDVIDYVTKGLPPSKKHYDHVMKELEDSDLCEDDDFPTLQRALNRVYNNRRTERNIVFVGLGLIAAGITAGCVISSKKDEDKFHPLQISDNLDVSDNVEVIDF